MLIFILNTQNFLDPQDLFWKKFCLYPESSCSYRLGRLFNRDPATSVPDSPVPRHTRTNATSC